MSVGVTHHGYERSKERINIKGKRVLRYAKLAYERGMRLCDASDPDLLYGISGQTRENSDTEVIVYNSYYWIFGLNGNLITLYPVEDYIRRAYEGYNRKQNRRAA